MVSRVFANRNFIVLYLVLAGLGLSSCAYNLGVRGRTLPGGYQTVEVPVFINSTHETGIEMSFTNSLIQEIERNKVAAVQREGQAPVVLQGEVVSVKYIPTSPIQRGEKAPLLPDGAVLATGYRVLVSTRLSLREKASGKELWASTFDSETSYTAPKVESARINSVNPLYNLSSRRRVIDSLAQSLMVEAHDRMTENF